MQKSFRRYWSSDRKGAYCARALLPASRGTEARRSRQGRKAFRCAYRRARYAELGAESSARCGSDEVTCRCMTLHGCLKPWIFCVRYLECVRELKTETPKPIDIEALFETFVAEFPVMSALDLFCNRCARPMALTYGINDSFFYGAC